MKFYAGKCYKFKDANAESEFNDYCDLNLKLSYILRDGFKVTQLDSDDEDVRDVELIGVNRDKDYDSLRALVDARSGGCVLEHGEIEFFEECDEHDFKPVRDLASKIEAALEYGVQIRVSKDASVGYVQVGSLAAFVSVLDSATLKKDYEEAKKKFLEKQQQELKKFEANWK
ncbi:hypothetical protein [Cronobacter phage vB_Cdu_VP8]|nr:hypothetical protein [Cronobacter phage vB_Cdu_VP8]